MIHCSDCPIGQCDRYESCDDNCDYVESWIQEHDRKVRADAINAFVSAIRTIVERSTFDRDTKWWIEWFIDDLQEQMKGIAE